MTSAAPTPTRQRLIEAALELFARQGVTETTTRQIAELAAVNEVTLFRHFGNKHGLLLAVIEEAAALTHWSQALVQEVDRPSSIHQVLKNYASTCLEALAQAPEFLRSVVGEAGQYPAENRQALGRDLNQANHHIAQYLAAAIQRGQLQTGLPIEKVVGLLNSMLLGYAVIQLTSEFHELWESRDDFLESLVELFLYGAVSQPESTAEQKTNQLGIQTRQSEVLPVTTLEKPQLPGAGANKVVDLPAHLVHLILQRTKKLGLRDHALAYVLFATGISPTELVALQRWSSADRRSSHQICDAHQHLLQITHGAARQVPVNRWILGKRYGTYTRNPLTQWLKSRKDVNSAMFVNEAGNPISESEVKSRWQVWTEDLLTPEGQVPAIEQAQQTWCVEMLMKGVSLSTLAILTGQELSTLEPYVYRAREKAALEQAIRLDQPDSLEGDRSEVPIQILTWLSLILSSTDCWSLIESSRQWLTISYLQG